MPRYVYRCTVCEELSTIFHLAAETRQTCPKCNDKTGLVKLLTSFNTKAKKGLRAPKTGEVTEQFIEDARTDLNRQREDLEKKRKQ